MKFKTFIFLSLLLSLVIISSAAVLENTKKDEAKLVDASQAEIQPEDANAFRRRCLGGCCGFRSRFGRCSRCCRDTEIEKESKQENSVEGSKYGGGGGGWGGGGHGGGGHGGGGWGGGGHGGGGGWGGGGHGGGGHGGGGGGHGGGGGGGYGGRCKYGCCGHAYGGGCKCCSSAAEAASKKQNENKP